MRKLLCALVLCVTTAQLQAQDTIRKSEIPVVAKFADLSFTQQEIDSMFDGVKENVFEIRKMHKYPLNNSTPMSMWQSPVVAGMQFDMKQQPINWEIPANVSLPANRNELAFYSFRIAAGE